VAVPGQTVYPELAQHHGLALAAIKHLVAIKLILARSWPSAGPSSALAFRTIRHSNANASAIK